jgi:hypothetical protein
MTRLPSYPSFFLWAALAAGSAAAAEAPARAPGGLREMNTDRPDATEGPFTVDPGHVQLEMDAATYTRNRLDGVRTTEWSLAPFNLRYGLTSRLELGIFLNPHLRVTEEPRGGPKLTRQGWGDTTLRAKYNLCGNDGGSHALGLIADVTIPTAADGLGAERVEGALLVPVAFDLGAGWDGGTTSGLAWTETGSGRRPVLINTVTVGHEIADKTGVYLEVTSAAGAGAHVATFNVGLTRKVNANLQLDCGANIGISRTAPDLTVFAGVSRRF